MRLLLSLFCVVALGACSDVEHQDLKGWMAEASKEMQGKVQPIPEIKPFPIVSYDAGNLMEPFNAGKIAPEKRGSAGGLQPDFDRPREPLEAYPLDSLKMVGVVRKGSVLYGLIAVNNTVHQVRTGNHLGQSFGVITSITEAQVSIKELVQDPSGQTADWVERLATLHLEEQSQSQKETKK